MKIWAVMREQESGYVAPAVESLHMTEALANAEKVKLSKESPWSSQDFEITEWEVEEAQS